MAAWIDAKPTLEFRIVLKRMDGNFAWQQKWKVAKGGTGTGVTYTEEWRYILNILTLTVGN